MTESEEPQFVSARRRAGMRREIPAWKTAGLGESLLSDRRAEQEMRVAPWMCDASGDVATGMLAVLCDSVVARAVMSTVPIEKGMATSHLHLELLRPIPRAALSLRCIGEQRAIDERFGLGEGAITDASGTLLAKSTIGAVLLDARPHHERRAEAASPPSTAREMQAKVEVSPILSELGTEVLRAEHSQVRLLMSAAPRFANASGGIHGGFGVLMGERTLDFALRTALGDQRSMRPVELRAAFLRPILADGTSIECRASVMHQGRRLAATRGEVRDHRGRPAVLVDATYINA